VNSAPPAEVGRDKSIASLASLKVTALRSARYSYWCIFLLGVCWCAVSVGQETTEAPQAEASAETSTSSEPATEQVAPDAGEQKELLPSSLPLPSDIPENDSAPDIFLLPDEQGNLRQVLGFRYEDFLKTWQGVNTHVGAQADKYLVESVTAKGRAEKDYASLRVEIELITQSSDWQEIPVQMPSAIIRDVNIEDLREGESLKVRQSRPGYVLLLAGEKHQRRKVTIDVLVPIKRNTDRAELELQLPTATRSQLTLAVATPQAQFETSSGAIVSEQPTAEAKSEVTVAGFAGPLRLEWTSSNSPTESDQLQFEATAEQDVRVHRQRVIHDVNLQIKSLTNPLRRVRVRLPAGAELVPHPANSEFRISPVSDDPEEESSRIIEIERLEAHGNWDVVLSAEQPLPQEGSEKSFPVGGFEVLGAFRQSGKVSLHVSDQLQVYFDLAGNVQQVPLNDNSESTTETAPIAHFAYASFPWNLTIHSIAQERRVNVRPSYAIEIDRDEARLTVELDYQFSGAKTFGLRIDMRDWRLTDDRIESGGVVDQQRYVMTREGLLILPLVNSEVSRVRLSFTARRSIQPGQLSFPLPEPLDAFVLPGTVLLKPNSALQVTPNYAGMEGVQPAEDTVNSLQEPPLDRTKEDAGIIELTTFMARPTLNLEVALRDREISLASRARIYLAENSYRVLQQFNYQVNFQPVSQLKLKVPETVLESDSIKIQLAGTNLQYREDSNADANGSSFGPDIPPSAHAQRSSPRDSL